MRHALMCGVVLVMGIMSGIPVEGAPARVLIVDGFSNHDWARTTAALQKILKDRGAFMVEVSTAPGKQATDEERARWRPDFPAYDVVLQNCNDLGGRGSWPEPVQQALEQFVKAGGGLYVFHSANNAFAGWETYNRLIGLGWRRIDFGTALVVDAEDQVVRIPPGEGGGTSHGPRVDALITRLGEHPIHRGLPRQWRAADLEIYRYARGPAEQLQVLSCAQDPKTGLRFPIEWVIQYDRGRIYNSTFGHFWKDQDAPPGMRCAGFQEIMVRAVHWLAGHEVSDEVPQDFPGMDRPSLRPITPPEPVVAGTPES